MGSIRLFKGGKEMKIRKKPMKMYTERPNDGSQRVWDYITKTYGKIETLQFNAECCSNPTWTAIVGRKSIVVNIDEILGKTNKI